MKSPKVRFKKANITLLLLLLGIGLGFFVLKNNIEEGTYKSPKEQIVEKVNEGIDKILNGYVEKHHQKTKEAPQQSLTNKQKPVANKIQKIKKNVVKPLEATEIGINEQAIDTSITTQKKTAKWSIKGTQGKDFLQVEKEELVTISAKDVPTEQLYLSVKENTIKINPIDEGKGVYSLQAMQKGTGMATVKLMGSVDGKIKTIATKVFPIKNSWEINMYDNFTWLIISETPDTLYSKETNEIEIAVAEVDPNRIHPLISRGGSIEPIQGKAGFFQVKTTRVNGVRIRVRLKNEKTFTTIGEQLFSVVSREELAKSPEQKTRPSPEIKGFNVPKDISKELFGKKEQTKAKTKSKKKQKKIAYTAGLKGQEKDNIKLEKLKNNIGLDIFANGKIVPKAAIESFKFTIYPSNRSPISYANTGKNFQPYVRNTVLKARKNHVIRFSDIIIKMKDGNFKTLPSILLEVK